MGYCVDMRDQEFFIDKSNIDKALQAIKEICKGKEDNFAWVINSDVYDADTLEEAMDYWGWQLEFDQDGNCNNIYCQNEKLGDDYQLFAAIAPCVKKGSFIEMSGEDGEIWRWVFDGKKCKEKLAKVTF